MIAAYESLSPPKPKPNWALFLDIDGTLIDLAPSPDEVRIPPRLNAILSGTQQTLDGAVAIVSGRTLTRIDALLSPLQPPCAGEHGAVFRLPDRRLHRADDACRLPDDIRRAAYDAMARWPGTIMEPKQFGICLHYRQAPEYRDQVQRLAEQLLRDSPGGFELLPGNMTVEIRHRTITKGAAVRVFMGLPPFAGRVPVFVGDDVTDEDGFAAARAAGGLGLHVDSVFGGSTANVRRWLEEIGSLGKDGTHGTA